VPVPTNEGDFIAIATSVVAKLNNTPKCLVGAGCFRRSLEHPSPRPIFMVSGDSMIYVNKYGKRIVDEKAVYNEKTQAFFSWDPIKGEYPNLMAFMIYDKRTADIWGNYPPAAAYPIPTKDSPSPYLISGNTLEDLAQAIEERLNKIASATGNFHLDQSFAANLKKTIKVFNQYAEQGIDPEFHRGEQPIDLAYNGPAATDHNLSNITMYPIASEGPYYAIIIAGGTLDTKGGPKINKSQVLILKTYLYQALWCRELFGAPAAQAIGRAVQSDLL
jgi:hypothetical protein